MPEESWSDCYAKYEMLRLDSCRFVWPKLSFIRKCIALTDYGKDNPGDCSGHNQLCSEGNIRTDYYDKVHTSVSKYRNSAKLEKFESFRNSHEKVRKARPSTFKRNREPIYSDDEAQDISSDEDYSCGNALFLRVRHICHRMNSFNIHCTELYMISSHIKYASHRNSSGYLYSSHCSF